MSKLSIIKIEDRSTKEYNALRIDCFVGEDPEEADYIFTKMVFENQVPMIYLKLNKKLGNNKEWSCDDEFSDCVVINGEAAKVAIPPHYYWKMKNDKVVIDKDRIVRFVKLTALGHDPLENELVRYKAQVPKDCWIEEDEEEVE